MNQANPSSGDSSHTTIFVVDDEPMLLDLAAAILEPLGYDVRTFRDPLAALEQFPAIKPVLVVTDYAMGTMNGLDLIRECKRINPQQKTVLLSGTVDEHIYSDSTTKPDNFLAKPYQVRDLTKIVEKLTIG